jgi:hypothetical protein
VLAVGTYGTAAAAGETLVTRTFTLGSGSSASAGYEGASRRSPASRNNDNDNGDDNRESNASRDAGKAISNVIDDPDDTSRGGSVRGQDKSTGIGWQSLLPGSIQ